MESQINIIKFLESWKENRVRNHVLFWLLTISLYLFFEFLYGEEFTESILIKLFYLPTQIAASYYLAYYQIPNLLIKKKYFQFLISIAFSTYVLCVITRFLVIYGLEPIISPLAEKDSILDILTNFYAILGQYLLLLYISPLFFILLKYAKDNFLSKRRMDQLTTQKAITELNFLRSQVHPHFLFNTLNNIYVLAIKKSGKTTDVVKKLADMMEYMNDTAALPFVTINEEAQLIRNYLDLEELRYGERLILKYDVEIQDPETQVAPLLFLSFVENAFKHGVSGDVEKPEVNICLSSDNDKVHLTVFNTKNTVAQTDDKNYKKGIGVSNVKKQLELLYPNAYSLKIKNNDRTYVVELTILIHAKMQKRDKNYTHATR